MASPASLAKNSDAGVEQVLRGGSARNGIRIAEFTYVYANAYATGGGDPCDLTGTFPNAILAVVLPALDDTGTVIPKFDKANKKMLAYKLHADDWVFEELGAVDAHTYTFKFQVIGW